MGWTYEEYINQPMWFIKTIISKINMDNYWQSLKAKQQKNGI